MPFMQSSNPKSRTHLVLLSEGNTWHQK